MVDSVQEHEETLTEFLASRARQTTHSRLTGQAAGAILAAVAIAVWRGPAWEIRLSIAACLFAFGVWGIADRELARPANPWHRPSMVLRATRVIAAVLGFAAAAFLMMALLGRSLGRIIS
jgi:hypothetical protein